MNFNETGIVRTSAVGSFPGGTTPYGNEEMSGNVWEWTHSIYGKYPYPQTTNELREREGPRDVGSRVLRGGAFYDDQRSVRCAFRNNLGPGYRGSNCGFRIRHSAPPLLQLRISDRIERCRPSIFLALPTITPTRATRLTITAWWRAWSMNWAWLKRLTP